MKRAVFRLCVLLAVGTAPACTGVPEGVQPVENFQLQRYLGKWYEIARLDHSFERGLSRVTARYSLREDGAVKVVNRGYSQAEQQWEEAVGKALFVKDRDTGYLKVSFFGPFYGSYVIFELDREDYQYSLVSGPDKSYLWILAREPHLDEMLLQELIDKAAQRGFPTEELIFVEQAPVAARP